MRHLKLDVAFRPPRRDGRVRAARDPHLSEGRAPAAASTREPQGRPRSARAGCASGKVQANPLSHALTRGPPPGVNTPVCSGATEAGVLVMVLGAEFNVHELSRDKAGAARCKAFFAEVRRYERLSSPETCTRSDAG